MLNKIKMIVATIAVCLATVLTAAPAMALTCPAGTLYENHERDSIAQCSMSDNQINDSTDTDGAQNGLFTRVNKIINVILGVLGIIAVVVIIIGGFLYMTSTGDAGKTKTAKDTIMYGIIGLVIALLAFAIVNFVLGAIFKATA